MRYFVPELMLGDLLPPQTTIQDKYGGLPWGLPQDKWPLCKECGNPLSHLATLLHDAERLDLGKEGRTVLIFQCNNPVTRCDKKTPEQGANAVIFQNADEVGSGVTSTPEPGALSEIEARVLCWTAREDLVTPAQAVYFYDRAMFLEFWEEQYQLSKETAEKLEESIYEGHKVGSVPAPAWAGGVDAVSASSYRFVAQLDNRFEFSGPPPEAHQTRAAFSTFDEETRLWIKRESTNRDPNLRGDVQLYIWDIAQMRETNTFYAVASDFGDGGIGCLFVNTRDTDNPEGRFSSQCY